MSSGRKAINAYNRCSHQTDWKQERGVSLQEEFPFSSADWAIAFFSQILCLYLGRTRWYQYHPPQIIYSQWYLDKKSTKYLLMVVVFGYVPWSKVAILGMVIPPLIGILLMGPYKPLRTWVEFPIPYGNNGSWSTRSHIWSIKCHSSEIYP